MVEKTLMLEIINLLILFEGVNASTFKYFF